MNSKTLEALRASIAHWDRLASGNRNKGEMIGVNHCSLCSVFYSLTSLSCDGCPVMQRTGKRFCVDSPYGEAANIIEDNEGEAGYDLPAFKETAMRELEFLRSLLPEDHLGK